jgi:lysylphosphatidylglycerol synthetase-like protein (DUF2156 family)
VAQYVNDVDRALSQLADIRAQLVASTRFRGIAPELNALTALLALLVATIQSIWPQELQRDDLVYVAVWAAVILAFGLVVALESVSRARKLHGGMAHAMLMAALCKVLPFAAVGTCITWVICTFAVDSAWLLPGLWQILIGLVGFSSLSILPRAIVWVAAWYLVCGMLVLVVAGWSGTLSPWMMGVPFVVGQAAVSFILNRPDGELDVPESA